MVLPSSSVSLIIYVSLLFPSASLLSSPLLSSSKPLRPDLVNSPFLVNLLPSFPSSHFHCSFSLFSSVTLHLPLPSLPLRYFLLSSFAPFSFPSSLATSFQSTQSFLLFLLFFSLRRKDSCHLPFFSLFSSFPFALPTVLYLLLLSTRILFSFSLSQHSLFFIPPSFTDSNISSHLIFLFLFLSHSFSTPLLHFLF